MLTLVVGGHFGDEGKGKIISYLALEDDPDIIARAGVGPNAGHTVTFKGRSYALRLVPSGFVNERAQLLIGAGVLIDTECFLKEVELTKTKGRIKVDERCGIIEEEHKLEDRGEAHLTELIKTTGSGCGPANADRARRKLKLARDVEELRNFLTDVPLTLNSALDAGKDVLIESSQGFALSLYYGTYPYVTSKDTSAASALADVGVGPKRVDEVVVVFKAYTTRVGGGPLRTMITEANVDDYPLWKSVLEEARRRGLEGGVNEVLASYLDEFATVTHRMRRVGAFDFELARYAIVVNSATRVAITCLDKLFPRCRGARKWEELPTEARSYVEELEEGLGREVDLISTGPEVHHVLDFR